MTLYIIFPIHVNSQLGLGVLIHSVKKGIIHWKNSGLFYITWESFLWKKYLWYCKNDIVKTCCIWLIFLYCHDLFLYFMFLYLSFIYLIFIRYLYSAHKERSCCWNITWPNILPCYFYLVHIIYYFYLTKMNLFISIPYSNQLFDKQWKKHFSVVICVCCIMSCSEIFFSQDGAFRHSTRSNKKLFIVANHNGPH